MGRNAKVSRETALRSSMKLFWARGFSATTMDEIQAATGLQRGSVYAYFKSKDQLYHEALDLYQMEIVGLRREKVRNAPTARKGIEVFFNILIEHSLKNRKFPGCLNTNTAAELAVIDESLGIRARAGLVSWENFWLEILDKGERDGSIALTIEPLAAARILVTLNQGINIVSKVNPNRAYLNQIVRSGLALLLPKDKR